MLTLNAFEQMQLDHYQDMLREAERVRLVRQALVDQPGSEGVLRRALRRLRERLAIGRLKAQPQPAPEGARRVLPVSH